MSQKYSLPGLSGIPIYDVVRLIYIEATKDDLVTRANSVAFSFFLSIFPSIIFIFTLIPLFPISVDYLESFRIYTSELLPSSAHKYLFDMVEDVVVQKRSGLLSIGFVIAFFFASSGMLTLMHGFDKSYNLTFKKRGYFRKRFVAIALTMLLILLFVMSIMFIIFGKPIIGSLIDRLDLGTYSTITFICFKWLILLLMFYMSITFIYRYGPSMYKRIKLINPGATLATLLSILSSIAFAYFINNFGRYNEIYGSIGALIVILVWIQINAFIILVGFELNSSIAVNRDLIARDQTTTSRTTSLK